MKNCWKTLGIRPTGNVDAIKSARRGLMKVWHPDVAQTIFNKELGGIRSAEINAACDEAVKRARFIDSYTFANDYRRTSASDDTTFTRAFLSDPLIWVSVASLLIFTQAFPLIPYRVLTSLVFGLACVMALNFSRKMMRSCARDQESNWLLLVIASASSALVCAYDVASRVLR